MRQGTLPTAQMCRPGNLMFYDKKGLFSSERDIETLLKAHLYPPTIFMDIPSLHLP